MWRGLVVCKIKYTKTLVYMDLNAYLCKTIKPFLLNQVVARMV